MTWRDERWLVLEEGTRNVAATFSDELGHSSLHASARMSTRAL